ncbi:MAG: TlpA family protein disulfide reductase [Sphingobacteriales bacterium]|nr:MAG: TlpA family protein disulfide reductase [Sphingobacteriales bacterium]
MTNVSYTYLSEFNALTKNSDSQKKLSFVRQNQVYFHPAFAEQLSGKTIVKNLAKRGITPAYQQDIAEFKALYPDSPILQEIAQLLNAKKDFTVGRPAMPFKVLELTGKEISLQDFQGKVVYLDFWSSSCVPCIVDIEQVKKVKEHFKGRNDIVFLYISLDTNEEKWKNAINKYAIKGTHGIAFDTNPVIEDYAVVGIPSYFIIGKV